MAGQKFEYDESGNTFLYFVLSFLGLILLPCTYYLWPNPGKQSNFDCNCEPCVAKENVLRKKKEPGRKRKRFFTRLGITVGWLLFAMVAYKIMQFDYELANFDPYEILGISPEATVTEIKKSYRKLSLLYHPDKETGDEKMFMRLTRAYQALTDETAKRNWELYGNPDGPGAMNFGIALPSWIVESENSVWVLGLYVLAFMVVLPTTVGIWWTRSIKYTSDKVLMNTTQLYKYFFFKTPQMHLKRILMVLGASYEYERSNNPEIQARGETDVIQMDKLMKKLPDLGENNKERPLCYPYSIKARALIHAHLSRVPLPPESLELDRQLVVRKTPYLMHEMLACFTELIMYSARGMKLAEKDKPSNIIARLTTLDTIEAVMKLSPMIIQAMWDPHGTKSPLLQLPHVTEEMQKHFFAKKRRIKTIQQFCEMKEEDRRSLFRNLAQEEYEDILRVCESMPLIDFHVQVEVQDDDEPNVVTAGAYVTVTVTLTRHKMGKLLEGEDMTAIRSKVDEDSDEDDGEDTKNDELAEATKTPPQQKARPWQKQKKKGKKGNSNNNNKKKPTPQKSATPTESSQSSEKKTPKTEVDQDEEESDAEENHSESQRNSDEEQSQSPADDDADWEKFQAKNKLSKKRRLEGKSKTSHPVHCPYFPEIKQEYWWLYVCTRKQKMLVTPPQLITNLVDTEKYPLVLPAPQKPGNYKYTVCLRSDSYLGFEQFQDITLDVQEAKEMEEQPQWDLSEDEEDKDEDGEGATDDDVVTDEDVESD